MRAKPSPALGSGNGLAKKGARHRRLRRESRPSPFVFVSERGSLFATAGRLIHQLNLTSDLRLTDFARICCRVRRRQLPFAVWDGDIHGAVSCSATAVMSNWPPVRMYPVRIEGRQGNHRRDRVEPVARTLKGAVVY
jgi:nitrite reductase/ring-hydroxylating ferredoxin subunit